MATRLLGVATPARVLAEHLERAVLLDRVALHQDALGPLGQRQPPNAVVDRYRAAVGSMDGRMFGRLSFLHAADENTRRATAARGAVESIWAPASLLPDQGVTWRAEDQNVIVTTFDVAPEHSEVRLTIDGTGAVPNVSVIRWGNPGQDDYGYIPFGGNINDNRRFADFLLPSKVSVGWWFGTNRFAPFFEAEVLDAVPVGQSAARASPVRLIIDCASTDQGIRVATTRGRVFA